MPRKYLHFVYHILCHNIFMPIYICNKELESVLYKGSVILSISFVPFGHFLNGFVY